MEIRDRYHRLLWVVVLFVVVVGAGAVGGFWYGKKRGYAQAETDQRAIQEQAAQKATAKAAKAANPFQAVNPLEGVEANPFEKTKNVLNPFK